MKIGIDIDDTITKTCEFLINEAIKFDKTLEGKGFQDENEFDFTKMFYWTIENKKAFFKYIKDNRLLENLSIRNDFKKVNKELYKNAEIIFISSRSEKTFINYNSQTIDWLNKNNIKYHKIFLNIPSKGKLCQKLNLDLFIDDNENQVKDALKHGINARLITSKYNKNENLERFENWDEILHYIKNKNS